MLNNKSVLENEINELKTKEKEHIENFKKLQDNMNDLQKRINNLESKGNFQNNDLENQIKKILKPKEEEQIIQNQNIQNDITNINNILKKKQSEISNLRYQIDNLKSEKGISIKKDSDININQLENEQKLEEICVETKVLKSELAQINKNISEQKEIVIPEIEKLKEKNKNKEERIINLEKEIEQLKIKIDQLNNEQLKNNRNQETINFENLIQGQNQERNNIMNNDNNSNINNYSDTNNNYEISFISEQRIINPNQIIHNRGIGPINICFKIEGKDMISIPAYGSDLLRNVFLKALQKINLNWINSYKLYFNGKDVTSFFLSNYTITSLNLVDNSIIFVYP